MPIFKTLILSKTNLFILSKTNLFIFFSFLLCGLIVATNFAFSQSSSDTTDKINDLQDQIKEYEAKIVSLQNSEKTLKNEIEYISTQVYYTQLKIDQANAQIYAKTQEMASLEDDITNLSDRLEKLIEAISDQEKVLKAHLRQKYKSERGYQTSPLISLMESTNFNEMVLKLKYLRSIEEQDKIILSQMNLTKSSFTGQKNLLTNKKDKIELLKLEIEKQRQSISSYKATLEDQKQTKQWVLEETQNDEQKYQELLRVALAESAALNAAVGRGVRDGPVKKGDPIALFGNSGAPGCSDGAHLHFEIRKNNQWVNPKNYLEEKTIENASMGDGDWEWPLKDPIILTQNYGKTSYSWRYKYSGGVHTGLDLVSNASTVITAPEDGVLFSYTDTTSCGSYSSPMNVKYIVHDDGVISYYLHVQ